MKAIHLKCEGRLNLNCIEMPIFESGDWDVPATDAEAVVGGMILLHEKKNDASYIGGIVESFRIKERQDVAHSKRIVFRFKSAQEGKGVRWRGADHTMAWYSGLVEF